jgi:hypothetical protein
MRLTEFLLAAACIIGIAVCEAGQTRGQKDGSSGHLTVFVSGNQQAQVKMDAF